jgi:hypothetical protein
LSVIKNFWKTIENNWGWTLLTTFFLSILYIIIDSKARGLDWSLWAAPEGPPKSGALILWGRPLWDWADLLLVPLVLAIGGFLLQRSERNTDRELAEQTRLDKTLDDYLRAMKELIVKDLLPDTNVKSPLRDLAGTLALTTIRRLDGERNRTVFRFLWGVGYIHEEDPIVSFEYGDLPGVNLEGVNLYSTNLKSANLREANLRGATLTRANMKGADLTGADLRNADLEGCNLENAKLVGAKMLGANAWGAKLFGVTWPDGTKLNVYVHGDEYIQKYEYVLKFVRPQRFSEKVGELLREIF